MSITLNQPIGRNSSGQIIYAKAGSAANPIGGANTVNDGQLAPGYYNYQNALPTGGGGGLMTIGAISPAGATTVSPSLDTRKVTDAVLNAAGAVGENSAGQYIDAKGNVLKAGDIVPYIASMVAMASQNPNYQTVGPGHQAFYDTPASSDTPTKSTAPVSTGSSAAAVLVVLGLLAYAGSRR